MEKLKITGNQKSNDTVTRTIRMSGKNFDKINEIAEKNTISFNSVVNQIIEYGLNNLDENQNNKSYANCRNFVVKIIAYELTVL